MNKTMMIQELKERILYNEEQLGVYEELHGEEIATGESSEATIWSEMKEWHKGKVIAFKIALEMAQEMETQ